MPSTVAIGRIVISRANHRPKKEECEFVLELEGDAAPVKAKKWEVNKKPVTVEEPNILPLNQQELGNAANVNQISSAILERFFLEAGLDQAKQKEMAETLKPFLHQKMTTLKNLSYSQGFAAGNGHK